MPQWEYYIVGLPKVVPLTTSPRFLNGLGRDGWEPVAIVPREAMDRDVQAGTHEASHFGFFKRPRPPRDLQRDGY